MKTPKSFRTGAFNKRRGKLLTILIHRGKMNTKSKIGYIKLYRSSVENDMYFDEPFNRWHAWQDLILLANHKDGKAIVRGNIIPVKKGQLAYAIKTLSYRWKWSQGKVDRFLKYLKNEDQIDYTKNSLTTIITVKNWERYQEIENETVSKRRADREQTETNKNDKEYTIINNSIETRAKLFQDEVAKFVHQYPKPTLRSFFDYWTEKNASGKKMKFEMQKTFEVSKRLATWVSRESDFKPVQKQAAHTNYALAN